MLKQIIVIFALVTFISGCKFFDTTQPQANTNPSAKCTKLKREWVYFNSHHHLATNATDEKRIQIKQQMIEAHCK